MLNLPNMSFRPGGDSKDNRMSVSIMCECNFLKSQTNCKTDKIIVQRYKDCNVFVSLHRCIL